MKMNSAQKGQWVRIISFDENSNADKEVSLLSLGILPGDTLLITSKAPFGGPISCKHQDNTFFALRRKYAKNINIEVLSEQGSQS